ncbi:MAG TPA: CpsD/CapB family tyrosine-protein kinase [Terriglobia bacterium]
MQHKRVLDEIRRLHEERRTGMLVLAGSTGERVELFFREGLIEAASSNLESRRIGDYLVKDGSLQPDDTDAIQSEAERRKIGFAEAAVEKKLLDRSDVGAAARAQAVDLVEHVLTSTFEVESFAGSLRSYYVPAKLSFSHVQLEMCRNNSRPVELEDDVRLTLATGADLSGFSWFPQELSILNELRCASTVDELSGRTGISEINVKKILGVLDSLGVLSEADDVEDSPEHTELVAASGFNFEALIPVVTDAVLNEKLEVARNEGSFTSEQFKNLKIRIRQANSERPIQVITVSSPDAQDGKSLISANLAFSFALDPGRRVAVVDCDLRNPALDKYLGVPTEPGLLQYLGNGHLSPYCYVRRLENLYFLTAGGLAPNPIEALSMKKMKQLVEQLRKDFDTVILDAPPYSPISDARIVSALSDAVLLVVRRGKTSYSSIDHAFAAADRNKLLGVVFNDVKPMLFHTNHQFGYYYGEDKSGEAKITKVRSTRRSYLEP